MKKTFPILFALSLFLLGQNRAHAQAFQEGSKVITIGYGYPNLVKTIFKTYQEFEGYQTSGFGPIQAKFDYGVTDKFGLGVSIGYLNYKVKWITEGYDAN